ncbi:hypothetical protein EVJ58_g10134 [Rhodofomes roseus]|uniref:Aminoglycoside phosphotransferase domain-containing protein n=1 Tax=Rhodofomes roseus TaxID=34475 RepID=A0A4Y9XS63_9APHY|nr:hypothetical protein EVJ58_g10134 [Rhodofomes roseus]
MASAHDEVQHLLSRIDNLNLPHPSTPLLSSFVTEAVNPVSAARYMNVRRLPPLPAVWHTNVLPLSQVTENGRSPPPPDAITRHAITKRDGGKCCITGKDGTFLDPLLVAPILPFPSGWTKDKDRILDMLGAFFGPPYRDWWLSYARNPEHMSCYCNHWLVRTSAAKAFARGSVRLDRLQPSMVEYEVNPVLIGPEDPIEVDGRFPLLGDRSRSGIETIDPRFVGTHARLCRSIRYVEIAKKVAPEILQQPSESSNSLPVPYSPRPTPQRKSVALSRLFPSHAFLSVWLMVPDKFRIAVYETLRKLGERLYGKPNDYSTVQRLPFGLYLKYQGEPAGYRNEFNALQTVHRHTSIPAPKPLDVVIKKLDTDSLFPSEAYLLITRISGMPLSRCQDVLSDGDCKHIITQLKDYLTQLRAIPKKTPVNADMAICNTLGEACRDPRIRSADPMGPFPDEAAFSQVLRFSDDPARRGHRIVFTHADLNPRNILVDRAVYPDGSTGWRVTGIVDWENAGYYPEYWDYTKALFEGFRWTRRYVNLVKEVFAELGDYSKELDVETRSWESGDGV